MPASTLCRSFLLTSESYARSYDYNRIAFFICQSAVAFVALPNTIPRRLATTWEICSLPLKKVAQSLNLSRVIFRFIHLPRWHRRYCSWRSSLESPPPQSAQAVLAEQNDVPQFAAETHSLNPHLRDRPARNLIVNQIDYARN